MSILSLHNAVIGGDQEMVSKLLAEGAKVDMKRPGNNGMTALQLAAARVIQRS